MDLTPIFPKLETEEADAGAQTSVAPLGGTRAQAMQRLQVGLTGVAGIILLVALAQVISNRAQQIDDSAVPEAAATVAVEDIAPVQNDPLVEAGVVPDLPAEPEAETNRDAPVMPEQGNVIPAE